MGLVEEIAAVRAGWGSPRAESGVTGQERGELFPAETCRPGDSGASFRRAQRAEQQDQQQGDGNGGGGVG